MELLIKSVIFLSLRGQKATFISIKLQVLQERYDDQGDQVQLNRRNNISERFVFSSEQEAYLTKFLTRKQWTFSQVTSWDDQAGDQGKIEFLFLSLFIYISSLY